MKRYLVKIELNSTRKALPPMPRDNIKLKSITLFGKGYFTFMQTEDFYANGTYNLCQYSEFRNIEKYGFATKQSARKSVIYKHYMDEKAKSDAKGDFKNWEYTISIVEFELE